MSSLLVFPDPPPPELAQSLDLAGFSWKAVDNHEIADEYNDDNQWSGAVIVADEDPMFRSPTKFVLALIGSTESRSS